MNLEFHYCITWLIAAIPNIGHAEASHVPDWVAHVWHDTRLIYERIDNRSRFLEAAACMLWKLAKYVDPKITKKELRKRETTLKGDLNRCIGRPDQANTHEGERIARYRELAQVPEYGSQEMDG